MLKEKGINKKRIGFIIEDRAFGRQGYEINFQGASIGLVSSGIYSPNLKKFIGMAFIDAKFANIKQEIEIKIRDKMHRARIVKFPFVESGVKRCKVKG